MLLSRNQRTDIGNEPPIPAYGRRAPDRREISLRWLSGTFLTGITSCVLMGVALFAAVDGREQFARPAQAMAAVNPGEAGDPLDVRKGGRVVSTLAPARPADLEIMEVSTVIREGDRDVVRRRPFAHIQLSLAANHTTEKDYPAFDPVTVMSRDELEDEDGGQRAVFYGAQVDSEITLRTREFPTDLDGMTLGSPVTLAEAEEAVRQHEQVLDDGAVRVATLHFVDPQRFASFGQGVDLSAALNSRVTTENVSVAIPHIQGDTFSDFLEDIVPAGNGGQIIDLMRAAGYSDEQASMVSGIFANFNRSSRLEAGDVLRLGIEREGETARIVRASLYSGTEHRLTVAENDRGFFVRGNEPANSKIMAGVIEDEPVETVTGRDLPTVYDGVYRAALSHGMNMEMTGDLVQILASSVDLDSRLKPRDRLELFFSVDEETEQASEESELLFVDASFGDTDIRLYRFRDPKTGDVGYYDAEGRSVRPFLIRTPVPNGRFTSPYGMRRHPILGYSRMHSGVDWGAPSGTPIIAPGDGIVQKAGWNSGGFGRHTEIQHANGYVTTYSHQSAIAKGVRPGAHVKQGQVIGYVGSTGMSTGPHLHYEMEVNGSKVDPMRVRLPESRTLENEALAAFEQERRRIDELLGNDGPSTQVASR